MTRSLLDILRCPYSNLPLTSQGKLLIAGEYQYPIDEGIPNLVDDTKIAPIDAHFQQQYGEKAVQKYDPALRFLSLLIGCWEPTERKNLINLLNPPSGGLILEVSVGTGANLPYLSNTLGDHGEIVGVDLSLSMMSVAQKQITKITNPIHLIRADACYLPFAENSFDAILHFGGINMFGDRKRALAEMVRVAKPGAPILVSDEGMSEARRKSWIGRRAAALNSLNLCRAPFDLIPWLKITDFQLHWAWREHFYIMLFRKNASQQKHHSPVETTKEEIRRRIG